MITPLPDNTTQPDAPAPDASGVAALPPALAAKKPRAKKPKRPPFPVKKPLRVLVLIDKACDFPDDTPDIDLDAPDLKLPPYRTELSVYRALTAMGHEVRKLPASDDLAPIKSAIDEFQPAVAFNLLEGFHDYHVFDQHVVSYLELVEQPYTGCNPRGLTLARDKAITKKILTYHRIHVPKFAVFPRRKQVARPKWLEFPLFVKSVNVEGSVGIAKASIVRDDDELRERVRFIHEAVGTYAIAEQYIEGRELYVGVTGNLRLSTFPIWELVADNAPADMPLLATERVKWSIAYRQKYGITTRAAVDLPAGHDKLLPHVSKRIYRHLNLTGYARLDFRMAVNGELYLIEANPNPQIARGEDFAESALAAGISYESLLQQILNLGMQYSPHLIH